MSMASRPVSTYGVWLISLLLEAILYGIGLLQTYLYFMARASDTAFIIYSVIVVSLVETVQIILLFLSSYSRFVKLFGVPQLELIWEDSLQLAAAYLGAFLVQIFFATRIYKLTEGQQRFSLTSIGVYSVFVLAVVSLVAGIAQIVWSYKLGSYLKFGDTKAITTVQSATSLACDLLITIFLCIFLTSRNGYILKTNYMIDRLIFEAINRGTLTVLASGVNLILFLVLPGSFWFFMGLAPSSKLYMNSMLATLNTRQRIREQVASVDNGSRSTLPAVTSTRNVYMNTKIQGVGSEFDTNSSM